MSSGDSVLLFSFASQPDIYRCHQKDSQHISELKNLLQDVITPLISHSIDYDSELKLISLLIYYICSVSNTSTCTAVFPQQTLGEEYCEISNVIILKKNDKSNIINPFKSLINQNNANHSSSNELTFPSNKRRLTEIVLKVFFPYCLHRISRFCKRIYPIRINHLSNSKLYNIAFSVINTVISLLSQCEPFITNLQKFHLSLFFLNGIYLELSKRITAQRYLYFRKIHTPRPGFQVFGLLILLHLTLLILLTVIRQIKSQIKLYSQSTIHSPMLSSLSKSSNSHSFDDNNKRICTLCLSQLNVPTATDCGHIFCWECITESLLNKSICPLCRQPTSLSQLLPLQNYQ